MTVKSSEKIERRHHPYRSKPKHRRTARVAAARISPAYASNQVMAAPPARSTLVALTTAAQGNKENLIQGWLQGLQRHTPGAAARKACQLDNTKSEQNARRAVPSPAPWAPHGLSLPEGLDLVQPMLDPRQERRHKPRRLSIDDSSIIASGQHPNVPSFADGESQAQQIRLSSAAEEAYCERGKKIRPDAQVNESEASLVSSPSNQNFEKRARHKTRNDRYDVVKHRDNGKKKKRKTNKSPVVESKKHKTKGENMISKREVMDKYYSTSILTERITMPPSLRPGLFDNGRASKKHVPDLTFHEMSFLKHPRGDPQQPLSRKRKLEQKRGEREREEISAFFSRKSLPDRCDAQGRKQPDVSGLSSHGGRTGGGSTHSHHHWHALDQPRLSQQKNDHHARAFSRTLVSDKGESNASTNISWSTSRPSTGPRRPSAINRLAPSSTPVRVRSALAQTGIFDNTGIHYAAGHALVRSALSSRDNFASARSPPKVQASGEGTQLSSDKPVRIVRYRDRGTMAAENLTSLSSPEIHAKRTSTQTESASTRAAPSYVAVVENMASTKATASTIRGGPSETTNVNNTNLHDTQAMSPDISQSEESLHVKVGPERPRAPKWSVVERLETLAENARPPNHSSPAASTMVLQPNRRARDDTHPYSLIVHTAQSNLMDFAPSPILGASGPAYIPAQNNRTSLSASTCYYPTYPGALRVEDSTSYGMLQSQYAPSISHLGQSINEFQTNPGPASMVTHIVPTRAGICGAQSSMQNYIAEIGSEVWDDRREGKDSRNSPLLESRSTCRSNFSGADRNDENESTRLDSCISSVGPPQVNRANASHLYQAAFAGWEQSEEQRFMSSFWRPNGYAI